MVTAMEILFDNLAGHLRLDLDLIPADNLASILAADRRVLLQDLHGLDLGCPRCLLLLLRAAA